MKPCAWAALILLALPVGAVGQEANNRLRVFLDCDGDGCDTREFRTEIQFVDWVLEATAADVHVIMTDQDAGAGRQHIIDLIGRGALQNTTDRLTVTTADTDTRAEELRSVTTLLKAGLARFLALHGRSADITISAARAEAQERGTPTVQEDPWNYWVFRIGVDGDLEGESRERDHNLRAQISANRTTLDWRLDFEIEGDFNRRRVELNDGRIFTNDVDDWEAGGLIVRSIGAQWSTGGTFSVSTSTRLNQRLAARTAAALEYSFFPYPEANRRALLVHYQVGVARYRYEDLTIFQRLEESVGEHRLAVAYDTRQTWGDADVSVQYSSILGQWSKNRVSADAGISVRLFRGLELDVSGGYERIRDQIYLAAEGETDEEIIAERRELFTEYQYEMQIGLSFRFGSVLNNFVNNRFPRNVLGFD
ncbi:MAG: hypothetical protein WEE89_16020 [Gemmatimonadota bacterium]